MRAYHISSLGIRTPLGFALAAVIIMNGLDAILTLAVVESGLALEANPLMAQLLEFGPCFFVTGKIALVSAGVWMLWRLQEMRLARIGGWAALCVYSSVMIYHTQSIRLLVELA